MTLSQFKTLVLGITTTVVLIALGGCSTMSVTFDYDKNVAWEGVQSYNWLATDQAPPTSASTAQLGGGLLDKRIREAVAFEMGERSIAIADDPDVLVKYHIGTEDKVQVTDWGYRYSDYYWGYGGRQIDVYQFTQGTVVLDIIDTKTKTLIWRGTATGTVDGTQKTPEEMQTRVNNVIHKILENFPPR